MKGERDDRFDEFMGFCGALVLFIFCFAVVCGLYYGVPGLLGTLFHTG